jgi:hypothetical protein
MNRFMAFYTAPVELLFVPLFFHIQSEYVLIRTPISFCIHPGKHLDLSSPLCF